MKTKLIILAIFFGLLRLFAIEFYNPLIADSTLNWEVLTDNIAAAPLLCLILWVFKNRSNYNLLLDVLIYNAFYIVPELLSGLIPFFGSFDTVELTALLIGGGISIALYYLLDIEAYYAELREKASV